MKKCSEEGCKERHFALGLCEYHYYRARRQKRRGNPDKLNVNGCVKVSDIPAMRERRRNGDTLKDIGATYGVNATTVHRYVKDIPLLKDVRECTVEGCHAKPRAKGMCAKHYFRAYHYGSPTAPNPRIRRLSREDDAAIIARLKAGIAKQDVAKEFGVSPSTISHKYAGIR